MNALTSQEKQQTVDKSKWIALLQTAKNIRWPYAALAFLLAVMLWYAVTVRDKVESWVDVQIAFKGAPENLVITGGLINKLSVRVRAAKGLSWSLSGRDATVVLDLSGITKGTNNIVITRDLLPFTSAYEVMEVSPPSLVVAADSLSSRNLPLESDFNGKLAPDLFVKAISITPKEVLLSGAENSIGGLSRILIPINLDTTLTSGITKMNVAISAPLNTTVTPLQVAVEVEVGVRTRRLKLTRAIIQANPAENQSLIFSSTRVTIIANIPESIAKDERQLAAISAVVDVPVVETAEPLPIHVTLPPNASLESVTPAVVAIVERKSNNLDSGKRF